MLQEAQTVFEFTSAANITRICPQRAATICKLRDHMRDASDASIFHHTFQSLEAHHYITEGFSNDFAQWVLAACNEHALAEQLAVVDVRDFVSLAELRACLVAVVSDYILANPRTCERPGFEPFHFCEGFTVEIPTGLRSRTLAEFCEGLGRVSLSALHFHFLTSRLRLELRTNDFSLWLRQGLDLPELAEQVERIDVYTNTLESVRGKILEMARPWVEE